MNCLELGTSVEIGDFICLDGEEAVLAAILNYPDKISEVTNILSEKDFYAEVHRVIFTAIITHYQNDYPIEIPALAQTLRKHPDAVEALAGLEVPCTGETVTYYARNVKALSRSREAYKLSVDMLSALNRRQDYISYVEQLFSLVSDQKKEKDTAVFNPAELPTGAFLQNLENSVEWIIPGILPRRSITILHGSGGVGKTWLTLQISEAIASGGFFLGRDVAHCPVIYVDFENPLSVLCDRARILEISNVQFWHASHNPEPPLLDGDQRNWYKRLPEGAVIIYDTLRSAHRGDENSSRDISEVSMFLKSLRDMGYTILVLHHTQKGNEGKYKGSTAIIDLADHELNLSEVGKRKPGEVGRYRLQTPQKSRYAKTDCTLTFDTAHGGFCADHSSKDEMSGEICEVMKGLKEEDLSQTRLVRVLAERFQKTRAEIREVLATNQGKLWSISKGLKNSTNYHLM